MIKNWNIIYQIADNFGKQLKFWNCKIYTQKCFPNSTELRASATQKSHQNYCKNQNIFTITLKSEIIVEMRHILQKSQNSTTFPKNKNSLHLFTQFSQILVWRLLAIEWSNHLNDTPDISGIISTFKTNHLSLK
jgi:hypothetical protein